MADKKIVSLYKLRFFEDTSDEYLNTFYIVGGKLVQFKGHVTRGNLSLQLAMQLLPKKILQVAIRMSDVRNLFCDQQ